MRDADTCNIRYIFLDTVKFTQGRAAEAQSDIITNLNRIVAENIRLLRCERGLSQEKLAELCDMHRTYIGAVERGERNITLNTLERIAAALNVEATFLLEEKRQ